MIKIHLYAKNASETPSKMLTSPREERKELNGHFTIGQLNEYI
jgi:hypothetical protein